MTTASRSSSFLATQRPMAAVEIASDRVTVTELAIGRDGMEMAAFGSQPLPEGVVMPALTGPNITDAPAVSAAIRQAWTAAGIRPPKRAALVVPDSVARVTMLTFEQLPPKSSDIDQLVGWQVRKATPFPIEDALITHVITHQEPGATTVAAIVARRDVITEYEKVVSALGTHPGIVDLASFSVVNTILASGAAPSADWLLVTVAPESTALAIVRGGELMFYRHRLAVEDEPLGALVHQTSMYHEDRLGGGKFARVWVAGASGPEVETIRLEISKRLGVDAEPVDVRVAVTLRDRPSASASVLDAMAAPVGVLLREGKGAHA